MSHAKRGAADGLSMTDIGDESRQPCAGSAETIAASRRNDGVNAVATAVVWP